jgi:peptidoglycan/xylan/chitin deacetylase (PgdA/CDA1 family)
VFRITRAWLSEFLRKANMSGTFFVLGKDIQARLTERSVASLQSTYSAQCVGVQGWEFRSHSHWQDWQDSVRRSVELIKGKLPENFVPLFRPPDGQRRSRCRKVSSTTRACKWRYGTSTPRTAQANSRANQSAQRVLTLMLLWRHGVINFNSKQDAVKTALPWLITQTAQSGIGWEDCQDAFR